VKRAVLVVVVVGLVAAGCSGGTDATQQTATLTILEGTATVDTGDGPQPATDGQTLHPGDTITTDPDGRAEITWSEGSTTRLDHATTFTITTHETQDGATAIRGDHTTGNTYHRVVALTGTGSRFDIDTPTATAAVQGTEYALFLDPDGTTTIAVLDQTVTIKALDGEVPVDAGLAFTVPAGAASLTGLGRPEPIPQDLLQGDWLTFNSGPPPFFEAIPEGDAVAMQHQPGSRLSVVVTGPTGEVLHEGEFTVGDDDDSRTYFLPIDLVAGDVVEVTDLGNGSIRRTTVVPLTFDVLDPDTDTLAGTADPGSRVVVFVEDATGETLHVQFDLIADGSGEWRVVTTDEIDLLESHGVSARIFDEDGDSTLVHAPHGP